MASERVSSLHIPYDFVYVELLSRRTPVYEERKHVTAVLDFEAMTVVLYVLLCSVMDTCYTVSPARTRVNLCCHVRSLMDHLHSFALHPAACVLCQPSLPAGTKRYSLSA